ncbi:PI-PLC X domain-containing protein 1 isoform 2 [Mus musculus]|uniref:PI-PLC X domain-containing protein 1 isoform 2 n=1 Tax=Mus musculus TaxID=10090 RepID=UPI00015AA29E|nr:PI-PLC X domain-containing protein 1 isoform 2 [Mus musculus]NP_001395621.1 PI-PLC X domain-containing protein 1 isoform 2 [Mus musculus]|eukprot:NP_001268741.1 PI-PLC X domain-containing protein 1 isoform 2 [Mus musculus]
MVGHTDPGRDAAAGCGSAVPGPADRACAGGLYTEPMLRAHDVHEGAGGGDTLTEIAEWLQSHPREVVILACRNFEGMTCELHDYLAGCIVNIFGDMLCPSGEVPTLRQLWAREQQVIVSYEDEATVSRYDQLWPAIPYWWGNAVKTDVLLRFLETMKGQGRPDGLFVAGINITENLCYILLHPVDSLEEMTRRSLPLMTEWVCAQQPGQSPQCTNIIAGDFVDADGFVSKVISLNCKLLSP